MALTISNKQAFDAGGRRGINFDIAFDSSYDTGGESLTKTDLDFVQGIETLVIPPVGGYVFQPDLANEKVKVLVPYVTYTATVDPASLGTDAIANTAVTITGAATTDSVTVIPPNALEAGIVVQSAWVSATNTVQLRLENLSAGTVDAASATWTFILRNADGTLREAKASTDLSSLTGVNCQAIGA